MGNEQLDRDCDYKNAVFVLATVIEIVLRAGDMQMKQFGKSFKINKKSSIDLVTDVDLSVEKMFRDIIQERFPEHGILSEEFGERIAPGASELGASSASGCCWVVDPIDGTRSFIIGSPTWSNLISVNYKKVPTFGLVNFPMLKKYYITGVNRVSYLVENNKFKKLKVLKSKSLNSSRIAGAFFGWLSLDEQKKISKLTRLMRYPCSDALSYCQLSEGKLDVVLQCYNKIWDIHPMIPLIKNAGGYITTWKGKDPRVGGSIVASSSMKLHKKILNLLKPVC